MIIQPMPPALDGVARLNTLGAIRVAGVDAAKFLHGQLTQDFALLGLDEARLCAFCSAKGRMSASFIGFKRGPDEVLLLCSRDILPATLKRLSMFVLRSKARLEDATGQFQMAGLAGGPVARHGLADVKPWTKLDDGAASLIALYPADQVARALWVAPLEQTLPSGPVLSEALWQWGEARSGIATVTAPIMDAFVPQMLNFESVGGVNFKKGCYPGQEIVARSQFRGTLKRRAYRVHGEHPMQAGAAVYEASDPSQPCGLVAQAAEAPDGGWDGIASMQIAAAQSGKLRLGAPDGPVLALLPLPYPLLADI
jgi:folate-binding protein YgfZ